ncbi:MAG: 3-dehydroquinate synthase, partial [Pyrinomonadaceae bacterium]
NIKIQLAAKAHDYEIKVGCGLLKNLEFLNNLFPSQKSRAVIVSNKKVFRLYGKLLQNSLAKAGFESSHFLMGDGEKYKNFSTLKRLLDFLSENKFRRTDFLIALGGGVVGDLAGFASAIYLRGIGFVQVPTTLLAMIDASVGGKTAINSKFGKNLIGAFYHPSAVIADVETLKTLPTRELTSGICEAIKQASLAGEKLFSQTLEFLKKFPVKNFRKSFSNKPFLQSLEKLISEQVKFKAQIVSQDDCEEVGRRDRFSRKILNFGHTIGHAIEKVTEYKRFKHGEAVGIGILVEAEISKYVANFSEREVELLSEAIGLAGDLPDLNGVSRSEILDAISFDKKNLRSSLEWILLEAIGKPKILDGKQIADETILRCIEKIFQKRGSLCL